MVYVHTGRQASLQEEASCRGRRARRLGPPLPVELELALSPALLSNFNIDLAQRILSPLHPPQPRALLLPPRHAPLATSLWSRAHRCVSPGRVSARSQARNSASPSFSPVHSCSAVTHTLQHTLTPIDSAAVVTQGRAKVFFETEPLSPRVYPQRKAYLHGRYSAMLQNSKVILVFQNNNLTSEELSAIKAGVLGVKKPEGEEGVVMEMIRGGLLSGALKNGPSQLASLAPVRQRPLARRNG